jgi:hypothetical protein
MPQERDYFDQETQPILYIQLQNFESISAFDEVGIDWGIFAQCCTFNSISEF